MFLTLDFETRSRVDLKLKGAIEYARDPSTSAMCLGYKFNDTPARVWRPGSPFPSDLRMMLKNPKIRIIAHNAGFERAILQYTLGREIPEARGIAIERFICTAAMAAAHALPRGLEDACRVLRLPVQKDMVGNKLMKKYMKPRKPTKNDPREWWDDELDLIRIAEYCRRDVEAEWLLYNELPPLSDYEFKIWCLDQEINDRGVFVDVEAVDAALQLIPLEVERLRARVEKITKGAIENTSKVRDVLNYVNDRGAGLENLQAKTIEAKLKDPDLDPEIRAVLELRQKSSRSSTAKFKAFKERVGSDHRARDLLMYHGASTGRWTGKGIQPQNFPRGLKGIDPSDAIELLKKKDPELLRFFYDDVLGMFSSTLRGMIKAPPGKMLFCADYAAIEARVLFWVAEHDKGTKAFETGADLYKEMAAVIFGVKPSTIGKDEKRELGKRAILGCVSGDTYVLTEAGSKPLKNLKATDKIWNGSGYQNHGGLLRKGLKSVIKIESLDIECTPCHRILSPTMWRTCVETVFAEDTRHQNSGRLTEPRPLFLESSSEARSAVSVSAAYVELKKNFESISFGVEKILFAIGAPNHLTLEKSKVETLCSYLVQNLESVGTYVSTMLNADAEILARKTGRGTAVAALNFVSHPLGSFWNALLNCAGLISPDSTWIELITAGTMSPETYESLSRELITGIEETYDVADVEGGNAFQAGRAIVHNCGYGMGSKKFHQTCNDYGLAISTELADKAVASYRALHSPVPMLWRNLERAAIKAVAEKKAVSINRVTFYVKNNFLYCKLPSGRKLAYYRPSVTTKTMKWGAVPELRFWSVNSVTKQWEESVNWGGILTENVVQAIARDLMADAMLRLDRKGYKVILSVHDELLSEAPRGFGSAEEFSKIMSLTPEWAAGLPVNVEGWSRERYGK